MEGLAQSLIFVGALVAIAFLGIHAHKEQKRVDGVWLAVANELGLKASPARTFQSRRLQGELGGYRVLVDTYTTGGKYKKTLTRYRIQYPSLGLGLKIRRQGAWEVTKKFFGADDIEVGHEDFDDGVFVQGRDADEVRAYLTDVRRLRIQRLVSGFRICTIGDRETRVDRNGLTRTAAQLESTLGTLVRLADTLSKEEHEPVKLERSLEERAAGSLAEALVLSEEAVGESNDDVDARVVRAEILLAAGRNESAGEALEELARELPEADEELEALARTARELPARELPPPVPDPAPLAVDGELDAATVCEELFAPGRMSSETARAFEEDYAGKRVRWSGVLERATDYRTDLVFGGEPGTKARLELHAVEDRFYGERSVNALLRLPEGSADALKARVGGEVAFEGTLVRCDPFMRNLFLADGRLV